MVVGCGGGVCVVVACVVVSFGWCVVVMVFGVWRVVMDGGFE